MSEKKQKLKFAFYWAASCGGCEVAVVDVNETILDVVAVADILFWPVAIDTKYKDVEAMPDKNIDVCFFNGAVRNSEQEHLAKMLRAKSKVMVAFGSCAHMGGVPGLANVSNKEEIFDTVYLHNPSTKNPEKVVPEPHCKVPEGLVEIPEFYDTVRALNQVVDVDYYLPGCPPTPKRIVEAVMAIATGKLPPKGTTFGPEKSVCDECKRKKEDKKISRIYRVYEKIPEPERCLLEQGFICMGPATRGGCEAQCIDANMPCTGCGGPCPRVTEQGAAMISALASILGVDQEKEKDFDPQKLIDQVKDPLGTFYRYSLPSSILRRKVMK